MNLFINYYRDNSEARQQEIDYCLQQHLSNGYLKNIICLCEPECHSALSQFSGFDKLRLFDSSRATFNDMFLRMRNYPNNINIICNNDIYFDESLKMVNDYAHPSRVLALTRIEVLDKDGLYTARKASPENSQDVWIFFDEVINPHHKIRCLHYHLSNVRNDCNEEYRALKKKKENII